MIEISDEDIEYSERIFLPEGCTFDLERRNVIKCMESKDIQACPGSGKTTALLAKLAILAQKMPLKENKGICVLTHTNVAIDEIKGRLGKKGDILFSYPNHFGTIQSFVDHYLAIPACIHYYSTRPSKIDSESYDFEMGKIYNKIGKWSPLGKWLYANSTNKGITPYELFLQIRIDFVNGKIKDSIDATKPLLSNSNNDKYTELLSIKENLFKQGILHYDDAYSLAFRYLNDFGEILIKSLSERFSFVFIDEMQDTDYHQNELISQIFDESTVVIQRFGDVNQSIYDNQVKENSVWKIKNSCLKINGSNRFSNEIANTVKKLCIDKQDLTGNTSVQSIRPKILVFENRTIKSVIPYFAEIIKEYNLCQGENDFKAIGWVGKKKDQKRTLPSYYPEFQERSQYCKIDFEFLSEYLQKVDDNRIKTYGANYYRQSIISSLLRVLKVLEIRKPDSHHYFTESSLIQYLEKKDLNNNIKIFPDEFNSKVAFWCLKIHSGEDILTEVRSFIVKDFCPYFNGSDIEKLGNFFDNCKSEDNIQPQEFNIYNKLGFNIAVTTVHSVKGKTHDATLYLETYFKKDYDINRIIKHLKNGKGYPNSVQKMSLKVAYVGMTRPTCLLCVAAHKDSISGNEEYLQEMGWEIREVKNEI